MILLQTETISKLEKITETLLVQGTHVGLIILKALAIFIIGRIVIRFINKLVKRLLDKRNIAASVKSFISSLINITLIVLLIISVISALGIQTTSFAALIASAGVAIGMALSGNLSNFAGGLIILLFKPFKVGDYISTGDGQSGSVQEIQIFHTILKTPDNVTVYIPNGGLSSGVVNNFNVDKRRLEWIVGVEYNTDFEVVKKTVLDILAKESRILPDVAPLIELNQLADSSVNVVIRVWVKASDYWDVFFYINKTIYETFNQKGIGFPFPQITVHKGEK